MRKSKPAIELEAGDYIESINDRPNFNIYRGIVRNIVPVDEGVEVNYEPSGCVIVASDILVTIRES